ncbi:hypothetical protein SAMN04487771_10011, partial [[Clostridium] aminophilum]
MKQKQPPARHRPTASSLQYFTQEILQSFALRVIEDVVRSSLFDQSAVCHEQDTVAH